MPVPGTGAPTQKGGSMTLKEAIKLLREMSTTRVITCDDKPIKALELGIEAVKRVKEARKKVYFTTRTLLPGETKE